VFKNNQGQTELAKNYPPTKAIIQETVEEYKQIASQKGLQLTNKQAEDLVDQTWRGSYLTKGFCYVRSKCIRSTGSSKI
jgi:hypothetical protein